MERFMTEIPEASSSRIGQRRDQAMEKGAAAYQSKRDEIARVAGEIFHRKGFQATTLADIAASLEIDRATLYYYFPNKQDIFDEVVREVAEADVAFAEAMVSAEESPIDKLGKIITSLMDSYDTHYPLLYVYVRENLSAVSGERSVWSKHMRNVNRRYDVAVTAIVQEGIDDGSIRPLASARTIAFGIIGMVGWTNRWFVPDRSSEDSATIGAAYAEMVLGGLASSVER